MLIERYPRQDDEDTLPAVFCNHPKANVRLAVMRLLLSKEIEYDYNNFLIRTR